MVLEAENSQKSATLKKTHLEKKLLNTMCREQAMCDLTHEPHESKNDFSVKKVLWNTFHSLNFSTSVLMRSAVLPMNSWCLAF